MATAVAIEKGHFQGGQHLVEDPQTVDQAGSKGLSQILRNFVEELSVRQQSGLGQIGIGTAAATIDISDLPDTSYDVQVTLRSTPVGAAIGAADLKALIVLDADKAVGQFKVTAIPAGAVVANVDFYWHLRSRTRLNSNK